jgi:hypothetical protein
MVYMGVKIMTYSRIYIDDVKVGGTAGIPH